MKNDNLKNIIVLKNLPSNLIDEAIVILKSNKNAKKLQLVENGIISKTEEYKNNNYIVKEAENVIANYIERLENNKNNKKFNKNIETKYKNVKLYSLIISIVFIICAICIGLR